jgi:hypothetical protein
MTRLYKTRDWKISGPCCRQMRYEGENSYAMAITLVFMLLSGLACGNLNITLSLNGSMTISSNLSTTTSSQTEQVGFDSGKPISTTTLPPPRRSNSKVGPVDDRSIVYILTAMIRTLPLPVQLFRILCGLTPQQTRLTHFT